MDNIDEFLSSLTPEEMKYLHGKVMGMESGEGPQTPDEEAEEPNASESDEYTNGKGPTNAAKGDNATVPKKLAKSAKKDSIPLKEAEMFDEED